MEIEAKFAIANRAAYRELLRVRTVAGFAIEPAGHVRMADRYFDTRDGRLLDAGYTCRIRTTDRGTLVTLKGLGGVEGAVHRRDEREIALDAASPDPTTWPDSPARSLALELTGGQPLQPLFDLEQDRARAFVLDAARRVAELSLDEVRAAVGRRPAFYYELEVELLPEGTEADLAALAAALQAEHGLTPEPLSKFQRALAVLRDRGAAVQSRLDEEELGRVMRILRSGNVELSRRAGAVLGWAEGLPTREIIQRTGLSGGRIRFWLREWRARRMGIFQDGEPGAASPEAHEDETDGDDAHEAAAGPGRSEPAPLHAAADDAYAARGMGPAPVLQSPARHTPEPGERPPPAARTPRRRKTGLPTVIEFAGQNGADLVRARFVAELAAELFDGLADAHRLPKKRRKLLRQAALLAAVGARQDPEHPHRAGRDLILAQPLHRVDTGDRLLLACVVAFQREKVKPEREPAMEALAPKQRQHALLLAALLQIAEALDGTRTQSATIEGIDTCEPTACEVTVGGPVAELAARQATARSGLWQHLTGRSLVFVPRPPANAGQVEVIAARPAGTGGQAIPGPAAIEIPPLRAAEPMSEAGRKTLLTHFLKMLANEAGTRLGEDIEALHDMRVATRRMRAAYRVFAPYFGKDSLDQFNKDLRRTGRLLGAVRDLDVLLLAAEEYEAATGGAPDCSIAPLLQDWHARRDLARRDMLDFLNSSAYGRFVDRFRTFLTTPGAGALQIAPGEPRPHQVRHVVPRLILERYEVVRAYEPVIETAPLTTYHALRIEFKGLRYALEFFRDVLGDETADLIRQITAMQDVLGALQDAHVAEGLVGEFVAERTRRKKPDAAALGGVERYAAALQQRQQNLLRQFGPPWSEITSRGFRRALAGAIAAP